MFAYIAHDLHREQPHRMTIFGERLAAARSARGLTQQGLAEATKVAVMTISNYETGRTKNPKSEHVLAIAKVLGLTTSDLLGDADQVLEPADVPSPQEADIQWAADAEGLDELGRRKLRAVRREIGTMTRSELLMAAARIRENASGASGPTSPPRRTPRRDPGRSRRASR